MRPATRKRRGLDRPEVGRPALGQVREAIYEARAAGYRNLEPGRWALQVLVRMTVPATAAEPVYLAWWPYEGIAVDGILYPLSCFTALSDVDLVAPGLSGESLAGIEMSAEPRGQIEIAVGPRFVISVAGQ